MQLADPLMIRQYDDHILCPLDHQAVYHGFLKHRRADLAFCRDPADSDEALVRPDLPYGGECKIPYQGTFRSVQLSAGQNNADQRIVTAGNGISIIRYHADPLAGYIVQH